jgi:hypothetical protein
MFQSKQRPIVIPQWEHQKLAGALALLWGRQLVSHSRLMRILIDDPANVLLQSVRSEWWLYHVITPGCYDARDSASSCATRG